MSEDVTLLTVASRRYDGFSTHTTHLYPIVNRMGERLRKVAVLWKDAEWQSLRFGSGLAGPYDQETVDYLIESGGWTKVVGLHDIDIIRETVCDDDLGGPGTCYYEYSAIVDDGTTLGPYETEDLLFERIKHDKL